MRTLLAVLCLVGLSVATTTPAKAAQHHVKDWTLLVYLNGDNSLDGFGPENIDQMEKIGSTDKVNVVVQWASESAGTTRRLFIQKIDDSGTVSSPVLQDLGKTDMGDYNTLISFIKWGVQNYPAQHYFIDVWDHGGGWHTEIQNLAALGLRGPSPTAGSIAPNDISWDDDSGHFITIPQLGMAMQAAAQAIGHKVDVYGSDACLMAMAEVAGEMADTVQYYVGSEQTEPGAGWPYDAILADWNKLPSAAPADVAKIVTDDYTASYENGENGSSEVTFSAFDMSQYPAVATAITNLGATLNQLSSSAKQSAVAAIGSTQTYDYTDYGDVIDYMNQLGVAAKGAVPASVITGVVDAVSRFVIDTKNTGGFAHSHGASIWLPADASTLTGYWDKYSALKFEQQTHWGETLKALIGN